MRDNIIFAVIVLAVAYGAFRYYKSHTADIYATASEEKAKAVGLWARLKKVLGLGN